jgi:hypothetical protein
MGEFRCNTISTCYLLTHSCHLDSCRLPAIDPYFLQSTHITDNPSSLSSLGSLTSGSHSDDSNFNNVSYDTSNDMSNFDPSLFNGLGFDFDESTGPTFDQNGLQQRQSSSFQPPPPTIPSFVLQHMHNNPNFLQQAQPYSQSSTAHVHPPPPPSYPTQQPNQPGTSSQIPFTFETQPPTPQQTSFQFAPSAFSFSQHPEPASSHRGLEVRFDQAQTLDLLTEEEGLARATSTVFLQSYPSSSRSQRYREEIPRQHRTFPALSLSRSFSLLPYSRSITRS